MSRSPKAFALLVLSLGWPFAPLCIADANTWEEADAKIATAKTPTAKILALYERAGVPLGSARSTRADWEKAAAPLEEALKLLDQIPAADKAIVASVLYFRAGYVSAQLENYSGSIRFYENAEKAGYLDKKAGTGNKGSELFANRAASKAALGDFAGAIADLDKAIALKESALLMKQRAQTRFESGDWDGAMADWKRAVALEPLLEGDADIDDEAKSPFDRALLPFNKAIADNPNSAAPFVARAKYRLAEVRNELQYESKLLLQMKIQGANETFKIISKDLNRAIKLEPKNAAAWRERGKTRAYFWLLNNGKGLDYDANTPLGDFNRALNLEDKNALTRLETGLYLLKRYAPPRQPAPGDKKDRRKIDVQNAIMNFSRAIVQVPETSADAHFQRALAERQTENPDPHTLFVDYSTVIAQQMKGIGEAPGDAEKGEALSTAHTVRGKILLSRGQRNLALQDFDAAIKAVSLNYDARFERGKLRVMRGEYDDALQDLAIVTANTNFAEAWLWQAAAQDGKGESEKTRASLQEAFKRDPNLKNRVRGTRYDEATPTKTPLAPAPDKNDAKLPLTGTALDHKNAGNALLEKGDALGALAEYNMALLIDPNFPDGYNNRGGRYLAQEKFDLALADFNRAIELDPKHRIAYGNRATLWGHLLQFDKQRADLDRAIEYADTPARKASAYVSRAKARFNANDKTGASSDLEIAKEGAAQDAGVWSDIGLTQLLFQQYSEAAVSFGRASELQPARRTETVYRAIALVLANDANGLIELKNVLNGIKPDDLADTQSIIASLLRRQPDSADLKKLQNLLNEPLAP